jgi:beta-lactamase superfamily II metal-dependent hydrolase
MLRIEMLPASYGDGLWIEYGEEPDLHRLLIDGGIPGDARNLLARAAKVTGKCRLELLVISHIDADHIGAPLRFLQKIPAGVEIGDVWFNGRKHLPSGVVSAKHGDEVSALLAARALPWNQAFRGGAVVVPKTGALPVVKLPGGATITLLSPGPEQLLGLARRWDDEVGKGGAEGVLGVREETGGEGRRKAGPVDVEALAARPFAPDGTAPNGSSIAFLFEHGGRRVLFAADAHAPVLERSLARLPGEAPTAIDAFKVPHHGSAKNISAALLARIDCRRFLVSTNGRQFHHPDQEAIARIVRGSPRGSTLYFNYRTPRNEMWDDPGLRAQHGYEAVYPPDGGQGLTLELPVER